MKQEGGQAEIVHISERWNRRNRRQVLALLEDNGEITLQVQRDVLGEEPARRSSAFWR